MKANYHTHTIRCMHAVGEDEEYILAAMRGGFQVLGMADHAPFPFANGFVSNIRMPVSDFQGYVDSILSLRKKYAGQIDVIPGLECEYFPRYRDWMQRMREAGIRYFICGQHYCSSEEDHPYIIRQCHQADAVRQYTEAVVTAIESGEYLYLAHPDLYMRLRGDDFDKVCEESAEIICSCAKAHNLPLEYNLLGLRNRERGVACGYPCDEFWKIAKKWDNEVILGADAHDPVMLEDTDLWNRSAEHLRAMGLKLLEAIPIE